MCRVPNVSGRGCYRRKARKPSPRAVRYAGLAEEVSRVWEQGGRVYGPPKAFVRLSREGDTTPEKRVARLVREHGWVGVSRRRAKGPDDRGRGA